MRVTTFASGVLTLALAAGLGGCGNDDEGDVESAAAGWRTANTVLTSSSAEFQQQIDLGVDGSISATCPGGGDVSMQGRFDGNDTYEFTLAFDDCQAQGTTMNGELSASASIMVTGNSSEVRFDYTGHIDFDGEVDLDCTIDVTGRVAASASAGQATAEASFEGSVCGVSAQAAIQASAG